MNTNIPHNNIKNNESEKNIHPINTFLSLIVVGAVLFSLMLIFPTKGIKIGGVTFDFPVVKDFLPTHYQHDTLQHVKKGFTELFDSTIVINEIDSAVIQYKLDSLKEYRKSIQVKENGRPSLHQFFDALDRAKKKKVRIMHYGDSQIEADRITSYLRNELQKKFDGYGPGLFPIIPIARKMSVNTEYSDNWKRYTGFGRKDTSVNHKKYGALMSFCRYAPITTLVNEKDSILNKAWIKIRKPKASYGKTKTYHQLKIFLSNGYKPISFEVFADGTNVNSGTITPSTPFQVLKTNFNKTPEEIIINFNGNDSPDIYGISLEGNNGVVMDNIPLRGSSGTIFTKQDRILLSNMYANLSPHLIIMQFGGNAVPYIKTDEACDNYGKWFQSQINFMKRLNPNAAIIIIGPSDMSFKEKTTYVTYPYLEKVRDVMKDAALNTNCLFWDMYEAMGGKNSMPKWVNATPALAGSDYTHFTPKGAKKIAEQFTDKLFQLYDEYKQTNTKKEKIVNDSIQ